jgi:hypothetical protein
MPDKYKFGDIHNKEYIDNLIQTLDEYKFYILIAIGVVAIGVITYTYWDSIYRRGDNDGDNPDINFDIPSPIPSLPSIAKAGCKARDIDNYPESYLNYFSKKIRNFN